MTSDSCPKNFTGKGNLGRQLIDAGKTFTGYSESMPSDGYTGCSSSDGLYARKHNPWVDFTNVPAASNRTYAAFPSSFASLPTVSFVTPNMCDDMHDCSIATGDTWLKNHIDAYAQWAKTHNSLLVLTWDEDDYSGSNQITTIMVGQPVKPGSYSEHIDHYTVLRTLEDIYGAPGARHRRPADRDHRRLAVTRASAGRMALLTVPSGRWGAPRRCPVSCPHGGIDTAAPR
ncbi:MAG: alkaline phosphatase family protein [Actinoallomurus sp.]